MPSSESRYFAINARTGMLSLVKTIGPLVQTITLVIKATQINNVDRYALTTVLVYGNEVIVIRTLFSKRHYNISIKLL